MPVTAVVGAQWGDEGKGRIIDYLAQHADLVIRFQGGDNAGHTVVNELGTFKLHLIPSGIFNPQAINLIGSSCVVNPATLLEELADLRAAGVNTDRLFLSERAHVTMPYHRDLDGLRESARGGLVIGTTKRGIGPAYADKGARRGLRVGDLLRPDLLSERLALALEHANRELAHFGAETVLHSDLVEQCLTWGEQLRPHIANPLPIVQEAYKADRSILLEGQLGVMRDLDWGIYPYVTSSNPTAAFASVGAGLPPQALQNVLGVVKAYTTAVGAGPLPTELHGPEGDWLREKGHEYGATTGRPRRCGWFDGVAIRYASWLNGFTGLAITKLDVLDELPEIKLCTAYRRADGQLVDTMPDTADLESVEPVYETWPGWQTSTRATRRWTDLPPAAQRYLGRIEELAGAPIRYVSVGPERDEMFAVGDDR